MRSTLCAVLLAISLLMPGNVDARDSKFNYDAYDMSCGTWLDLPKSDTLKLAWITGYMTAINLTVEGKRNFFESTDTKSIILFVNKFCRENPLKKTGHGMGKLLARLKIPALQ